MSKIKKIDNYGEFKGVIRTSSGISDKECGRKTELNMINVVIKTQGTSDYFEIKEFSSDFSDDTELKEITKWIDLMITDKFTVMGSMITRVKQKGMK